MNKYIYLLFLLFIISCRPTDRNIVFFENKNHPEVKIPFLKSEIKGNYYYFILDSGANMSLIDSTWESTNEHLFEYDSEIDIMYTGITGIVSVKSKVMYTKIDSNYVVFTTANLSLVKENLKKQGFDIIGILGSDYLLDNQLIINYYKQAVYSA